MTKNSGKEIPKDYLRSLVRYGVLSPKKLGNINMYPKSEVDAYVVEERGENRDVLNGKRLRRRNHYKYTF